ncbi:MAG: hypothetical protein Q4E62_03705 [Sutterellaceae bacterium]|nr:hypothetical protein [Sutterellaceae bacterium]
MSENNRQFSIFRQSLVGIVPHARRHIERLIRNGVGDPAEVGAQIVDAGHSEHLYQAQDFIPTGTGRRQFKKIETKPDGLVLSDLFSNGSHDVQRQFESAQLIVAPYIFSVIGCGA